MIATEELLLSKARTEHGNVVDINTRVWFIDNDGYRVVYRGWDTPLYSICLDDEIHLRYVAVWLRLSGLARQHEIAAAFGHSVESQRRWERRYEVEGLEGRHRQKGKGATRKITGTEEELVRKWLRVGESN